MKEIVRGFNDEIELLSYNAWVLKRYIETNFDMNERNIEDKFLHSFRVAKMCLVIAKKMDLDTDLAYNIGLLHDYSRFDQWARFHSFYDKKTVDHGDYAAQMLFDKGEIEYFEINREDYALIRCAIENHNKAEIDRKKVFEDLQESGDMTHDFESVMTYSKLIRDCDKMDIFNRIGFGNMIINSDLDGYTPEVMDRVKQHKYVINTDVHTKLDRILHFIGLLYDLNFAESVEEINLDNYFMSIDRYYGVLLNDEDHKVMMDTIAEAKEYMSNYQRHIA